MTDIVEQLRAYAELPYEGAEADPLIDVMRGLATEAADEIERLRSELQDIADTVVMCGQSEETLACIIENAKDVLSSQSEVPK